jgi:hypothetical protein
LPVGFQTYVTYQPFLTKPLQYSTALLSFVVAFKLKKDGRSSKWKFDGQISTRFFSPKPVRFFLVKVPFKLLLQNTTMSASELSRLAVSITAHSWNADNNNEIRIYAKQGADFNLEHVLTEVNLRKIFFVKIRTQMHVANQIMENTK